METTLNIAPSAVAAPTTARPDAKAVTTRVQAVEKADAPAVLPARKPFVAQVVTARLSGVSFPEKAGEIAPPERTLRPYNVPMLPYDTDGETGVQQASEWPVDGTSPTADQTPPTTA